jgi:hypothetical protein
VVLDENNYIVDMHLKAQGGQHHLVTGNLIHVGRMKKQIKLQTADGEKVFPLAEEGQKTKGMGEGELVTVELNEAGTVIDSIVPMPEVAGPRTSKAELERTWRLFEAAWING